MGIQQWSKDVILVNLAPEPQLSEELDSVSDMIEGSGECSVVVDFSDVDIITSSSLAAMLNLHKQLSNLDRELLFCSVSRKTNGLFEVVGLDNVFNFIDDKFVALAAVQLAV